MRSHSIQLVLLTSVALLSAALVFGCGDDGESEEDFCRDSCPAVLVPACTNGPVDMADCISGCTYAQTSCPSEFSALSVCAGTNATYHCGTTTDSPEPDGCETESAALNVCLGI